MFKQGNYSFVIIINLAILSILMIYAFFSGPRRLDGLRAIDVMGVLQEQLAILSGGRDRRGGALLTFPATPRRERAKPEDYRTLLQYLLGVPW